MSGKRLSDKYRVDLTLRRAVLSGTFSDAYHLCIFVCVTEKRCVDKRVVNDDITLFQGFQPAQSYQVIRPAARADDIHKARHSVLTSLSASVKRSPTGALSVSSLR